MFTIKARYRGTVRIVAVDVPKVDIATVIQRDAEKWCLKAEYWRVRQS
jgi:hypothetical protein